jgi:hypothetical protein
MTANNGVLIELDARGRASIGKLARHRRYLAALQPDGTIVLTPAAVVPASAWSEVAPGLYVAPLDTPEPMPFGCDKCGRRSVHKGQCGMTQPDNTKCEGMIL